MKNSKNEYNRSTLDINLSFDKGRESDFKMILNKQFGIRIKWNEGDHLNDEEAALDRDFQNREEELQVFRQGSQSALYAPLLTQAMVKKTRQFTDTFQFNEKELTLYEKFRSVAKMVLISMMLATRWQRVDFETASAYTWSGSASSPKDWYCKNNGAAKQGSPKKKPEGINVPRSKPRISDELQQILRKLPTLRTNEDIVKVQRLCRKLGVLSNFPVEREYDVAQVIGYECYEKGRVLSLQGRLPIRLYHILRGKVNKVKTIELTVEIRKQYFEEVQQGYTTDLDDLQSGNPKGYSLIAKSFVEVLVMEKEDVMEMLHVRSGTEDSNIVFLRSLELFETYPLDSITPDALTTKYFPKDTVIMKNIDESPYFYVIKSGTCKLLQKYKIDHTGVPLPRKSFLPRIRIPSIALSTTTTESSEDVQKCIDDARLLHNDVSVFLRGSEKWEEELRRSSLDHEVPPKNLHLSVTQAKLRKPKLKRRKKKQDIPTLGELVFGRKESDLTREKRSGSSSSNVEVELSLPLITVNNSDTSLVASQNQCDDVLSTHTSVTTSMSRNTGKQAFFQVGSLKIRDIYGLETMTRKAAALTNLNPSLQDYYAKSMTPDITVVSEGTECILVDKKLFLNTADFFTLSKVAAMNETKSQAEDAKLQVEKVKDWGKYKKKVVNDVLNKAKIKKKLLAYR